VPTRTPRIQTPSISRALPGPWETQRDTEIESAQGQTLNQQLWYQIYLDWTGAKIVLTRYIHYGYIYSRYVREVMFTKQKSKPDLPAEIRTLLPLTPAVFYTLFALANGEKHGYAIMQSVKGLSNESIRMGPGTLYTTIQRLLKLDLIGEITSAKRAEESERRRRVYRLTGLGRRVFDEEVSRLGAVLRQVRLNKLIPREVRCDDFTRCFDQ
jgi:DNA-binding PadR family transcriptional regulator